MSKVFFTPGPSQLYPTVAQHLETALVEHIPSISHRSSTYEQVYEETENALRDLLRIPSSHHIFFLSSANEIWERILQSFPDKPYFFVNGNFSSRFYRFAAKMGLQPSMHEVAFGQGFREDLFEIPSGTQLIAAIGNETSSGAQIPIRFWEKVAAENPDSLVVVDAVSAFPTYDIDFKKIDGAYFSVQKGFGMPAGLGVWVMSDRAVKMAVQQEKRGEYRGVYHSLSSLQEKAMKHQNPETPNVLGIYLLGKVARDMVKRGEGLREESKQKAERLYGFFEAHSEYRPHVRDLKLRSETVVVVDTPGKSAALRAALDAKGFVVGSGYGSRKNDQIRIANFPATSLADVEALLKAFQEL